MNYVTQKSKELKLDFSKLILYILVCLIPGQLAAFLGTLINNGQVWNDHLIKPSFAPPAWWFFVIIWTINYITIGITGYLLNKHKTHPDYRLANTWYWLQLVYGFFWIPVVYFAQHISIAVFMDITDGFFAFMCAGYIYKISKNAFYWFTPYLLWTCFTTFLKITMWIMNGSH